MKREISPPKGVFPADSRRREGMDIYSKKDCCDGMPHDMGGHEGRPKMVDKAGMHAYSDARDKPAQTHNRHGGHVNVEVGKASARPVGN